MTTTQPALYQWYAHLRTLETAEQLSEAMRYFKSGTGWFEEIAQRKEMGKARTALINRAKACNCYQVRDDSFRQYPTRP